MAKGGIFEYVKEAFRVPYNLILVSGGFLAGIASLQPLIVWPVVAALEIVYLLSLAHNPRFQKVVRARGGERKAGGDPEAAEVAGRLLATLDDGRRRRFEGVRGRCEELQRALATAGAEGRFLGDILAGEQSQSVNKLLWIFLRTLAYEQAVENFCAAVPRQGIEASLQRTEEELARQDLSEAMRTAHAESAEVMRKRLENLERAEENLESLRARLLRIENSILLIQEQALTRRDPELIEAEVKAATVGLSSVEEMMRTMAVPALDAPTEGPAPELLRVERGRERA